MKPLTIALAFFVITLITWLPFSLGARLPFWNIDLSEGSMILWKNYDGPNYLIVAKTWYDKASILENFSNPLPAEYYPAHFPFYPAVIATFDSFMSGPNAMLVATAIGGLLFFLMFYKYLSEFKLSFSPMWLTLVLMLLPARFVSLRVIGTPEPWFMLFILASIYNYKKERYWLAGIFAALAQLTKSPAIILFAAYGLDWLIGTVKNKKINWSAWPLLLQPVAILGLFWFYAKRTGDFFAYFNSGDNFHLFFPPFSIFSPSGQVWVGNFWLEDIVWTWMVFGLGVLILAKRKLRVEYLFSGLFFLSTLFVAHRDISRYIIPIAPFILVAFDKYLQKREFKIVLAVIALPIMLYTWNFLLNNIGPVADWAPYL